MGRKRTISALAKSVARVGRKGSCVEGRDPAVATRALELLAEGRGVTFVSEETGIKFETLVRMKARHKTVLDERRAMLAEDALEMAEGYRLLQKEKMRMLIEDPEQLAKMNVRDLAVSWGIANDKFLGAMGENRVVVEHKGGAPSLADAIKAIEEARAAIRKDAIPVEVVVEPVKEIATT